MTFRSLLAGAAAILTIGAFGSAAAAGSYIVDAQANSSSGAGVGLPTINLSAGELFTVSVDPNDLWNAGALPRWSNANGLTGPLLATGTDDSGEPAGTLIGSNFGLWTEGNLTAPYGTLVGEIGSDFEVLGTSFSGPAWGAGTLNLFYWDSNSSDNTQFITASVVAVPEPATWAMMLLGMGAIGAGLRMTRRKDVVLGAA
jgi:hypothetical protein